LDNKKARLVSGLCGVALGIAVNSQSPPSSEISRLIGRGFTRQNDTVETECVEEVCEHL
jgi:hypothetical protein